MKEQIGVRSLENLHVGDLKRDLLIFDKLYIVGLKEYLFDSNDKIHKVRPFIEYCIYKFWKDVSEVIKLPDYLEYLNAELEYLISQGRIILNDKDIIPPLKSDNFSLFSENSRKIRDYAFEFFNKSKIKKEKFKYFEFISLIHELSVRDTVLWMGLNEEIEVYPIINSFTQIKELDTRKQQVYKIILRNLPMPSDKCDWERIFDFKNDTDSYYNLLSLKNWVNKVSTTNLTSTEVEDELEYKLYKYKKSIELHKLKTESSLIESVFIGGLEIVEDLAKLKFSKLANKLFKMKKQKIELLEIELKTEGSEISYISKINEKFKS